MAISPEQKERGAAGTKAKVGEALPVLFQRPHDCPAVFAQGVGHDRVGRAAHAQRSTVSPCIGPWSGPGPNSPRRTSYTTVGASVPYWSQLLGWRHLTVRLAAFRYILTEIMLLASLTIMPVRV